jgi:ribosome-binding factor A
MAENESQRQKKFNKLIQQELATLLQNYLRKGNISNLMISVTKAFVTSDLSIAKIYISIFPSKEASVLFQNIKENKIIIRHDLSQILKNELRRVPELLFFLDDSLDYIEGIEKSLKSDNNPIYNPELLPKRKK